MDQATKLREMMMVHNEKKMARVITVTSGKGGVGKTSISVNLAIALSKLGKRVVILDADLGLANVEVMLGMCPQTNLADLMFNGKKLNDIITKGPNGVGFISGGSGIYELNRLSDEQVTQMIKRLSELDNTADVVIVDTGAGISKLILEFISASSEVLLVATPEPTSITDAYALLKVLDKERLEDVTIKIISNRVSNYKDGEKLYTKLQAVVEQFLSLQIEYMGAVVQDDNLAKALMQQKPVSLLYPNAVSSKGIIDIAKKLEEDDNEDYKKHARGINGFLTGLLRNRKNRRDFNGA